MYKNNKSFSTALRGPDRKRLRVWLALLLAIAMLFTVYGSLIQPAISTTTPDTDQTADTGSTGEPLHIEYVSDPAMTGVTGVTGNMSSSVSKTEDGQTKYTVDVNIDFHLTADTVTDLPNHADSIKFNLGLEDQTITAQQDVSLSGPVTSNDSRYLGQEIGTYYMDVTTGDVTIKFDLTSPYFKENPNTALSGGYIFKAWVWNEQKSDEDKTFTIVGDEVLMPIHRAAHPADLSVQKDYNNDFFYGTEGESMQSRRSLGSSFNITVKSDGGIDASEVDVLDTLTSDNVHFDLAEGKTYDVYKVVVGEDGSRKLEKVTDGTQFTVTEIKDTASGQELAGTLSKPGENSFKDGFEYVIKCPVAVDSEYLAEDGNSVDTNKLTIVSGNNNVNVSTPANGGKSADDAAPIQVNLKADIAKYTGVYDAASNKMHWKITIYKDNGWWQNGHITVEDFFKDGDVQLPRSTIDDSFTLKVVPGSNTDDSQQGTPGTTGGEEPSEYGVRYSNTENGFVIDMDTSTVVNEQTGQEQVWNTQPIKEFLIEYDTEVTEDDYGTTMTNWTGLVRPTGGYTDQDTMTGSVPKPSVDKSGSYDSTAKTITWTVKVNNSRGQDLSGLTLNDTLTADEKSNVDQIDFSDAVIKDADGNPAIGLTANGSSLSFPKTDGVKYNSTSYTITYVQELAADGDKGETFTNDIKLENSKTVLSEDSDKVHIPQEFEAEKSYALTSDGAIVYTIRLVNEYGSEIGHSSVTDKLTFSGLAGHRLSIDDFDVTVSNGTAVSSAAELEDNETSGLLYYQTHDTSTLDTKFFINEDTTANEYVITYTIKPKNGDIRLLEGLGLRNSAEWDKWPDHPVGTDKTIEKPTDLSEKTGSYDEYSNTHTWKFTVYNKNGIDLGTYTGTSGGNTVQLIDDTDFGKGKITSFTITDKEGNVTQGDLDALNAAGGKYQFPEGSTSTEYTFVYTAKNLLDHSDNVSDTVTYDGTTKQSNYIWSAIRNGIDKSAAKTGETSSDGTAEVRWRVTVTTYEGGLEGKPITDTMRSSYTVADSVFVPEGVDHYMTASQCDLSSFTFTYITRDGNTWDASTHHTLTDPEDYFTLVPVTEGEKIKGFTIQVKDDLTEEQAAVVDSIVTLLIDYNTTLSGLDNLSKAEMQLDDKLSYRNTTEFNGNTKSVDKDYIKKPTVTKYDKTRGQNTDENAPTEYNLDELTKDADDNYLFTYYLQINNNQNFTAGDFITATDTMPEGMSLSKIDYSLPNKGVWGQTIAEGTATDSETSESIRYEVNGQKLKIYIPGAVHEGQEIQINYVLKISPADMSEAISDKDNESIGSARFTNRAEVGDGFDTQPVIVHDNKSMLDKQLVSPLVTEQQTSAGVSYLRNRNLEYVLDINKYSKDLIEGSDKLNISDIINGSGDSYAQCPLKFSDISANSISLYTVTYDTEGQEVETPLDTSLYSFSQPVKETRPVVQNNSLKGDVYSFTVVVPDKTYIRLKYTYSYDLYEGVTDNTSLMIKNNATIDGESVSDNANKEYDYNKAMEGNAFTYNYNHFDFRKYDADNWLISLADAKFIIKRYSEADGWENLTGARAVHASVDGGTAREAIIATWGQEDAFVFTTNENGTFNNEVGGIRFGIPSFQTEQDGNLVYEKTTGNRPKYIYLMQEIESPEGYYLTDEQANYYFYEADQDTTAEPLTVLQDGQNRGLIPRSITLERLASLARIEFANKKMELDVQKNWYGDTASDRPAEVKVDLWQSSEQKQSVDVPVVTVNINLGNYNWDTQKTITKKFNAKKGEFFKFEFDAGAWGTRTSSDVTISNNKTVTTNQVVNEDMVITIDTQTNNQDSCEITQLSEPAVITSPQFDEATATKVQTVTLNAANNWHADFDTSTLDSLKYYYITEQTVDGYYASYEATGLRDGTFELTNFKDNIPRGSLKIDKQWLGDEANVSSLEFTVKGFTKKVDQETSDYASKNSSSVVVEMRFYEYYNSVYGSSKTVKFLGEVGKDYYLYNYIADTGNGVYFNCIGENSIIINGVKMSIYDNLLNGDRPILTYGDGNGNGDARFNIPVRAEYINDGVMHIDVPFTYTGGSLSNMNLTGTDSNGSSITVHDGSEQLEPTTIIADPDAVYAPATVTLPENEEPYIERTLTMVKTAGKWSGEVKNLPLKDDDGNDIYYYVEEASGNGYVPINYSDNGFTLTQDGEKTVTVLNQTTEQTGFELPETGGEGVWLYYITGAGLMMTSALFIHIKKRRRAS